MDAKTGGMRLKKLSKRQYHPSISIQPIQQAVRRLVLDGNTYSSGHGVMQCGMLENALVLIHL